jgi:hypothetical protein
MFVDAQSQAATGGVTGAIRQAARLTGTSFHYLLAAAKVESNLNPAAKAGSSSAGGLFQFIDQTWLGTLKQSGASLGYGQYAEAIEQSDSGRYTVADAGLRSEIMKLRHDPAANAAMAGAFTKSNAQYLSEKLGREPNESELYIAHFLGARGAAKLIGLATATPNAIAADSFPRAAGANRSIFYAEGGRPRSFADVTRVLAGRYDVARGAQTAPVAANTALALPPTAIEAARIARAYESAAPETAAVSPRDEPGFAFDNPYRAVRHPPVAQQAAANPAAVVADRFAAVQPSAAPAGEPLGLFQDTRPNVRALFTGRS